MRSSHVDVAERARDAQANAAADRERRRAAAQAEDEERIGQARAELAAAQREAEKARARSGLDAKALRDFEREHQVPRADARAAVNQLGESAWAAARAEATELAVELASERPIEGRLPRIVSLILASGRTDVREALLELVAMAEARHGGVSDLTHDERATERRRLRATRDAAEVERQRAGERVGRAAQSLNAALTRRVGR
jgi:colicin import membrane protein